MDETLDMRTDFWMTVATAEDIALAFKNTADALNTLSQAAAIECVKAHARRNDQLSIIQECAAIFRKLVKLTTNLKNMGPELKAWASYWGGKFRTFIAQLLRRTSVKLNANPLCIGAERIPPSMPKQQPKPRTRAPLHMPVADDGDSGGGGPDEPDPDPAPDRPYIALGIDHKATTPAGPPVPVSLRLFSLYRIEMRYCHDGKRPDHPEP